MGASVQQAFAHGPQNLPLNSHLTSLISPGQSRRENQSHPRRVRISTHENQRTSLSSFQQFRQLSLNTHTHAQNDDIVLEKARAAVLALVEDITTLSLQASENGLIDKDKYVIPPHLHDLHEADLPETQRGLVISEIAQFRERAAKREREKLRETQMQHQQQQQREWGRPSEQQQGGGGYGNGAQGYQKPVAFTRAEDGGGATGALEVGNGGPKKAIKAPTKSDIEMEEERKEARRREEETSFRDVSSPLIPFFCVI